MAIATSATRLRSVGKLIPSNTTLLVCDIQERFRPLIHKMETVIQTSKFMTSVANELKIPIVVTQQYTKVFGPTISEALHTPRDLGVVEGRMALFEKKKFSMLTDDVSSHISSLNRTSFLLVGIEAHVCLQQTCLDLLELGHEVHIIADGVSSQQPYDREMALRRMENCGAYLTTAQSAAFMLLGSAEHDNFKAVSGLVKDHMVLRNEFNE
jgi:nicotinamidase-related amidase